MKAAAKLPVSMPLTSVDRGAYALVVYNMSSSYEYVYLYHSIAKAKESGENIANRKTSPYLYYELFFEGVFRNVPFREGESVRTVIARMNGTR